MKTGDGALAWSYLRSTATSPPVYDDGAPCPVRVRAQADLLAETHWRLLAWENPDGEAASAFSADAPMLEGSGSASAPPPLPLLTDAGATVEGLRLDWGLHRRQTFVRYAHPAEHSVRESAVRVADSIATDLLTNHPG